jgi:hypothetical protein
MSVFFLYPDVGTYIMNLHAQIVKRIVDEIVEQFGMDLSNELE